MKDFNLRKLKKLKENNIFFRISQEKPSEHLRMMVTSGFREAEVVLTSSVRVGLLGGKKILFSKLTHLSSVVSPVPLTAVILLQSFKNPKPLRINVRGKAALKLDLMFLYNVIINKVALANRSHCERFVFVPGRWKGSAGRHTTVCGDSSMSWARLSLRLCSPGLSVTGMCLPLAVSSR